MTPKFLLPISLLALILTGTFACKKDPANETARLRIRLTDAQCGFDSVVVNVQSIEFKGSGINESYPVINPGFYDLLLLNNGLDTLLLNTLVGAGILNQIRLILGPGNYLVKDGTTHPLSTPSAQQSGLKIQVHQTLGPGLTYDIWLDFDACQSIVQQGNGTYSLKPVIRAYTAANSGAISGTVSPPDAVQYISVTSGSQTIGTVPNPQGQFLIPGLPPATYTLSFTAAPGYANTSISGISVTIGQTTQMGTIEF
jgi:hypothetical protein